MAKSIRANLQLASENDCRHIAEIDAQNVSSNPKQYVSDNLLGYYVAINSWLMIIQQWSRYGWVFVLNYIKEYGLFKAIRAFDESAAEVINGSPVTFSIARTIFMDVGSSVPLMGIPTDPSQTMHRDPLSAMLLVCRFLKRFSPINADLLRNQSIQDFQLRQSKLKALQRQPHSRFIVRAVRDELSQFLDWDRIVREIDAVDISDIVFTPGVSFDTSADLVSKLKRVRGDRVEYFPIPFGIPLVAHTGATEVQYWGFHNDIPVHCVRLSAVPKNYKTARVIAPEDVVRQAYARRYFNLMDRHLPGMISLHDQTQNQKYAFEGSVSGRFATIDLSAASDSITMTHLCEFFPNEFVKRMQQVLPTHYEVNGKRFYLQSAATMGNSVTFWLESVLFAGIASAAVKYFNLMANETDDVVSVYGDDIIVPTNAAQTVMEWLQALGFEVNTDKSYASRDILYRESCGEEYMRGVRTSAVYFPRFPIQGSLGKSVSKYVIRDGYTGTHVDTLTALVDLQHKMFNLCTPAALLISEVVTEAEPRMTFSTPDEALQDLWSYESKPKVGPAPAAEIVDGKLKRIIIPDQIRERHLVPITVTEKGKGVNEDIEMLVSLYNYQQFLKYGPRYDTPLDELLGVSSPPISMEEAQHRIAVKWVYLG